MTMRSQAGALPLAQDIRSGLVSAHTVVERTLSQISASNDTLNCFTTVLADEALETAWDIDRRLRDQETVGPLAGVPFAVKDLFDIAGTITLAGSKIRQDMPPATVDATAVARLKSAGAVLVGATNMDEYAYGFTTENAHYGPTRNPHDAERISGGSSGGSAAAVAAALVPLALGSDTNGSIRVPAALCGVFGMKPTFGRLSRAGVHPFVNSLDHVGHFARSTRDLAAIYDTLQGADPRDPNCASRAPVLSLPELDTSWRSLRVGVLDGWFRESAASEVLDAVDAVADALGGGIRVELPSAERARSAAYCITAAEGGALHLSNLALRPEDFDPGTRGRLIAGTMLPAAVVVQAQRFRRLFRDEVARVFETVDILLAPSTPFSAPRIGEQTMQLCGDDVSVRANIGLYTQPLSFIGLPVVAAPVHRPNGLPIGVQIVAPPWQENIALRVAARLETMGIVAASVAA